MRAELPAANQLTKSNAKPPSEIRQAARDGDEVAEDGQQLDMQECEEVMVTESPDGSGKKTKKIRTTRDFLLESIEFSLKNEK
jgi:hypothetical protein